MVNMIIMVIVVIIIMVMIIMGVMVNSMVVIMILIIAVIKMLKIQIKSQMKRWLLDIRGSFNVIKCAVLALKIIWISINRFLHSQGKKGKSWLKVFIGP